MEASDLCDLNTFKFELWEGGSFEVPQFESLDGFIA